MAKSNPFFVCPQCGSKKLHEKEIGPVITREVRRINWQYHHTVYETYYITQNAKKWWVCGKCGWELPVKTETDLISWLQAQRTTDEA